MAFNIHKRHNTGDTSWHKLDYSPLTLQTKWVKFEDGKAHIRITQPDALTYQMLEANKREANDWDHKGGWSACRLGAVVARVPTIIDTELKKKAGYEPAKSGWYDKAKYNSFLDDPDYKHFRTNTGKVGRSVVNAPLISKRFMNGTAK